MTGYLAIFAAAFKAWRGRPDGQADDAERRNKPGTRDLHYVGQGTASWRDPRNWSRQADGAPLKHLHARGKDVLVLGKVGDSDVLDLRGMPSAGYQLCGFSGTLWLPTGGRLDLGSGTKWWRDWWQTSRLNPRVDEDTRARLKERRGNCKAVIRFGVATLILTKHGWALVPRWHLPRPVRSGLAFAAIVTLCVLSGALAFVPHVAAADVFAPQKLADLTDASISLPADGDTLVYDSTASAWRNISAGVINPKSPEYGAKGNNSHDDTAALQAAFTAAAATSNGVIFFWPAGIYLVTSKLTMTGNGITIVGGGAADEAGSDGTRLRTKSTFTDTDILDIRSTSPTTTSLHGITLRDFMIDGFQTSTTASGVNALNSATVNVASAASFPASGSFYFGGVATTYTGKSIGTGPGGVDQLTGCGNHDATTGGESISLRANANAIRFGAFRSTFQNVHAWRLMTNGFVFDGGGAPTYPFGAWDNQLIGCVVGDVGNDCVQFTNGSSDNTIIGGVYGSAGRHNIYMDSTGGNAGNRVEGSYLQTATGYQIYCGCAAQFAAVGVRMRESNGGIYLGMSGTTDGRGWEITGCEFKNCSQATDNTTDAIYVNPSVTFMGGTIDNNTFATTVIGSENASGNRMRYAINIATANAKYVEIGNQSYEYAGGSLAKAFGTCAINNAGTGTRIASITLEESAVSKTHTGDTTESTFVTVTVPAGLMGANGRLRVTIIGSKSGTAGTGEWRVKLGGSNALDSGALTAANLGYRAQAEIANRGAQNSQVVGVNGGGGWGSTAAAPSTLAIDTSADVSLTITGQCGNAGDTIKLEQYLVELIPG